MTLFERIRSDLGLVSYEMKYTDRHGVAEERVVSPIAAFLYLERPTMLAWCHKRDGLRMFYVKRIVGLDPCERRDVDLPRLVVEVARQHRSVLGSLIDTEDFARLRGAL